MRNQNKIVVSINKIVIHGGSVKVANPSGGLFLDSYHENNHMGGGLNSIPTEILGV